MQVFKFFMDITNSVTGLNGTTRKMGAMISPTNVKSAMSVK